MTEARDVEERVKRIVSEILHLHLTDNVTVGHIAILYRGNHQERPFEEVDVIRNGFSVDGKR